MKRDSSVLDSLRAIAVSLVLVDHLAETFGPASIIPMRTAWQLGRLGVIFFFVHTSYVLMLSMQRRGLTGRDGGVDGSGCRGKPRQEEELAPLHAAPRIRSFAPEPGDDSVCLPG